MDLIFIAFYYDNDLHYYSLWGNLYIGNKILQLQFIDDELCVAETEVCCQRLLCVFKSQQDDPEQSSFVI